MDMLIRTTHMMALVLGSINAVSNSLPAASTFFMFRNTSVRVFTQELKAEC